MAKVLAVVSVPGKDQKGLVRQFATAQLDKGPVILQVQQQGPA